MTEPLRARTVTVPRPRFPLAERSARFAAWLLDWFLGFLTIMPAVIAGMSAEDEPDIVGLFGLWMLFYLPLWIYQAYLRATQGQTIGKRVLKIRIVCYRDGSNPGFWRAVGMRDLVPGIIQAVVGHLFWILDNAFIFGGERRCLHDYMAATIVVRADFVPGIEAAEVFR